MTMDLVWVLLLAHAVTVHITSGSEVVVQVNTKKWMYYVPERFLSLTVDPLTLAAAGPLTHESFNMAKGLSPSFVRLGGIGTNAVYFGKKFMENSTTVSESQWDSVNDFAKRTGLDLIASLNPTMKSDGVWDPRNSQELISYSSKKHCNVAWQLGYDMQGYDASGADVGKDLVKLRKILDGVSGYANSPVFGPDVTSVSGAKQIRFIKDLLANAGNPLACLILRPKFKNDAGPEDALDLMASMTNELDTYVWNKDIRLGRSTPKKPIWIAEPVASQGTFEETKKFVIRIGHAARLGVQIYLRQAGIETLKSPTPDYWFSLLYKTLVGQGVLDYKIVSTNQTGLHVFTHCTPAIPQEKSVLDTDWNYEKGAVTLFGVNTSPGPTKLVLKVTNKEESIHVYTLTSAKKNELSGNNIAATLLNGQELKLSPTGELPVLSPKVKKPSRTSSVTIPGDSVFFVVMPDSKVRTCSIAPISAPDLNLSELTKRLRLSPQKKMDESKEEKDEEEEAQSEERVYVSFTKKRSIKPTKESETLPKGEILGKTLMRTLISKLSPRKIDLKLESNQDEPPVKYITFNENSFMNKLAEGLKEGIEEATAESAKEKKKIKNPPLTDAIRSSKSDETETAMKKSNEDVTTERERDNVEVISIIPLNPASSDDVKPLSRTRRSSTEEPMEKLPVDSDSMEIIKGIVQAKKKGTPLKGEMSDVYKDLSQHNVTWKLEEDPEENARNARHASLGHTEGASGGTMTSSTQETVASEHIIDTGIFMPRNARHVSDTSTDQESSSKDQDLKTEDTPRKDTETENLAKIVEKTETISAVSESPQAVLIPEVPQEKLDDLMLKAAKLNSDPEPDGSPGDNASEDPLLTTEPPEQPKPSLPILMTASQQLNAPLIEQAGGQNSPLPGQFNPMVVPSQINPSTLMANDDNIPKATPSVQQSDSPSSNTEDNNVPMLIPTPPVDQGATYYDEHKEGVINGLIKKITNEENSALAKMSSEGLKQGMVEEVKPSEVVPINVDGQTVLIASEDLAALKKPNAEGGKSAQIESTAMPGGASAQRGFQTLADPSEQLELASEDESPPSPKVARQVPSLRLPLRVGPTPKATTATLASPIEQPMSTTPGPVSPFPATKDTKPSIANQLPPIKPPTPEELRERYKVLREKMLELRQQYLEARDKRLEEFRKQVIVARAAPETDDAIKSTIKRREIELKDWFKRFDKRQVEANPLPRVDQAKSRPRRLSLFTNDENFDMETFFGDDPVESYNYKRSPEVASSTQQLLHQNPNPTIQTPVKTAENVGKLLIPLDSKAPQGIVYNNRIYPARLFGYIDPQSSYSQLREPFKNDSPVGKYGEYKVREAAEVSTPITRERLAYVPKDAFIKEFKSDFVPVVILDPEDPTKITRSKRSTMTDLEEQFHHVKDELFPKIRSWIKNFRENPPWKRDLERSSRTRRSLAEMLATNDLRSLKYRHIPKPSTAPKAPEIEDFVLQNIDKGENDIYEVAKKYTGLAENIDKSLSSETEPRIEDNQENRYCEEIGTSGKSVIRDPFAEKSKSSSESVQITTNRPGTNGMSQDKKINSHEQTEQNPSLTNKSAKGPEHGDTMEETMFASIVADKIREFFENVQVFFGASHQ